jgi:hypothetical protein
MWRAISARLYAKVEVDVAPEPVLEPEPETEAATVEAEAGGYSESALDRR